MSIAKSEGRSPGARALAGDRPTSHPGGTRRGARVIEIAHSSVAALSARAPEILQAARIRARGTTRALQTLPDPTLRWLAACSVGLGAGLHLAGAPRLVTGAGLAPAALMGAAIMLRPPRAALPAEVD